MLCEDLVMRMTFASPWLGLTDKLCAMIFLGRQAHFSVCCLSLMDFLPRMSSMRLVPDCGLGSGRLAPGAPNGGGGPGRPACLPCCGGGPGGKAASRQSVFIYVSWL